jgi:hypothetical protein
LTRFGPVLVAGSLVATWWHRQGAREGHEKRQGFWAVEREAAVRAALAAGTGIRRTARLVGTGNATVARIAAEMRTAHGGWAVET